MAKRHVDDGIAGGRTVTLEIKIPNGRNCLKCPAHSKNFGKHACLLYGAWLNTHTYRKKATCMDGLPARRLENARRALTAAVNLRLEQLKR